MSMKEKCKTLLASLVYAFYEKKLLPCEIHVMSIDETLDELLCTQKSLVRFGDGEIIMIRGKSLYFQHSSFGYSALSGRWADGGDSGHF